MANNKKFKIEKGSYMDSHAGVNNKDKGMNDIINEALNINIEEMTEDEMEYLRRNALDKYNVEFYIDSLKSLNSINNHLLAFITSSNILGGPTKNVIGNKNLYSEISIIADRLSDIICSLFISFPKNEDYFTFDDYNRYVVPILNNLITIIKQIEYNGEQNEKLPLNIYTTSTYFNKATVVFKIEYRKDFVDPKACAESAKYIWKNLIHFKDSKLKELVDSAADSYLELSEYKRVIKNATPTKIFFNELIEGGVLNEIIDIAKSGSNNDIGKKLELGTTIGTTLVTKGTAAAALKLAKTYATDAEKIKKSINIFSKITGTAKYSAVKATKLAVKSQSSLVVATVARGINIASTALLVGDLGVGTYNTYKKVRLLHRLDGIYGINEEFYKLECNQVYRNE